MKYYLKILILLILIAFATNACLADSITNKRFVNVTKKVGLTGLKNSEANWIDYNNDGFVDLYVSGQLWENIKGTHFKRIKNTPLKGKGTWADFDNDGYIDFFSYSRGELYRNIKGKTFKLLKNAIPKLPTTVNHGAVWFDLNSDGLLDLYIGGYGSWKKHEYYPDVILKNLGNGKFKKVWQQSAGALRPARGITTADYDENGAVDIYVSNYRLWQNILWKNDGKGHLTNVAYKTNSAGNGVMVNFGNIVRKSYGHTIGSAWGDFDNDGHLDLFVGNFSHASKYQDRPQFLKNLGKQGKYKFKDMSKNAGLKWQESFASPALADFDNDTNLDLFFTTVYKGDKSVLYKNIGNWHFKNVTKKSGIKSQRTYQAAWGDFNNDGYLDLVTDRKLYLNKGGKNSWLKVKVVGEKNSNRLAIGAQVRVYLDNKILTRQVSSSTGQGNQNEMTTLFGLGKHNDKVKIKVTWPLPDKKSKTLTVRPNQLVTVKW